MEEETKSPEVETPKSNRLLWLIGGMIIGGILGTVLTVLTSSQFALETQPPLIETMEITREVTVVITAPPETAQPVTPVIQKETVIVVATLPPATQVPPTIVTDTAESNDSPSATADSSNDITISIFTDDFEDGPDPSWEIQYGMPGMANGKYTVIAPFEDIKSEHFSLIDGYQWGDISLTFELSTFDGSSNTSRNSFAAVVIHYQKEIGGVGFIIHPDRYGFQFGTIDTNGDWNFLSSSLVIYDDSGINLDERAYEFRIEVIGDTYIVYINNQRITSATIVGYRVGQVGLWFAPSTFFDVPDKYSARFEYISIESLP